MQNEREFQRRLEVDESVSLDSDRLRGDGKPHNLKRSLIL